MNLFTLRTWKLGLKSLTLHPMRSLLTVLGIFVGVSSVIWLLSIGEGAMAAWDGLTSGFSPSRAP